MSFKFYENILGKMHIPKPHKTALKVMFDDGYEFREFIQKKLDTYPVLHGGTKIKYNYNNTKFILYDDSINNSHSITIHRKNDKNKIECVTIETDPESQIAYINNISYYDDCVDSGLIKPGGGSLLLKMAIQFLKDNKDKYNITKIQLKDNSSIYCKKINKKIPLSIIYMLSKGDTWYGKHGFKPYDIENNTLDKYIYKKYKKNKNIVINTLIKDTNIYGILKKTINKHNLEDILSIKKLKQIIEIYNNKPIIKFFKDFLDLGLYDNYCIILYHCFEEIIDDINVKNLAGTSYFMDI